jgi:putative membrane-bound dehydrogenase-like protein
MKTIFIIALFSMLPLGAQPVSLFDGKSLDGWEIRKGEEKWWRVEDGMITGGSLTETVPFNTFIASGKTYQNFDLRFKIRLVKGEGFINSGMQIRSKRNEADSEMIGYQVDAGDGFWGDLYDESRRNRALAKSPAPVVKEWDWNEYRVLCEGNRIRTWINGVVAVDYTEKENGIPTRGQLGLQAHGGGKFLVQMKDVSITEFPSASNGARSPEEERAGFTLPAGYTAELVASEEQGVGKPVTVAWDHRGKMWTMTALEYPVDANENEAAAQELYITGGKDRVLVFNEPNGKDPQTPAVFADGLAIPLGVLPTDHGTFVQHGTEIRRYHDKDGDGKADGFEVILDGFGIQDSHLFPHQFERAPGGWIYLAQGAFNYSKVRRPGGEKFADGSASVTFNNCKMARFRPDGSAFEPLTGGANNFWGLVLSRTGECFLQEANDLGIPVAEFVPGTNYVTFSSQKLREDAPILPLSTPNSPMGGTGLSGLALAEDDDSPFAKNQGDGAVFYLANPITSRLQVITMTRDAAGHPLYKKGEDFMLSNDPWFRPISIHFGPDGCLYVVDWYNKIISHNEVPRTHPDRDKTHGRIWRIRHDSQNPAPRIDITKSSETELLALLGGANALVASQAWQEIVDRNATRLSKQLIAIVEDPAAKITRRLGALWAAEGLGAATPDLLERLASSPESELRHEAVRIAGEASLPENDFLAICEKLQTETHYRVRAAIANAVRAHHNPTAKILEIAAQLGLEPLPGDGRESYDRNFERYIARWAMSMHPETTHEMLKSPGLPAEARLLAVRSFENPEAAVEMVKLLPELKRPLFPDELGLLGSQLKQPSVMTGFADLLKDPNRRESMLRAILQIDLQIAVDQTLATAVETACDDMLAEKKTPEREHLMVQLARKFGLTGLSSGVGNWMRATGASSATVAEGLATLRRIGLVDSQTYRDYLDHPDDAVRREALIGFANAEDSANVVPELAKRWPGMPGALRSLAVSGMTSAPSKAAPFAKALSKGEFRDFDSSTIEKLTASLGSGDPDVIAVLEANKGLLKPIIRLDGSKPGRVMTHITLKGPFTVEAWIKLDEGITNDDALLGNQGGPDFNFYDSKLRVFGGPAVGDLIISNRVLKPGVWTHCAVTRNLENKFAIYLDGEPDLAQGRTFDGNFENLNLGESNRGKTCSAGYDEVRVWNKARNEDEIRRDCHTSLAATATPDGLVLRISGETTAHELDGGARVVPSLDFPKLVTTAEAAALSAKFDRFRKMTALQGDPLSGKQLAQATCMICHQMKGEGRAIGPNLSGAGAMGVEALLRNILTPNAQLESGYYRHDIKMTDGTIASGFLAGETPDAITIRQIGADDRVIPRSHVTAHEISRQSLMPEGLLDGFSERQVADLFTFLNTLR